MRSQVTACVPEGPPWSQSSASRSRPSRARRSPTPCPPGTPSIEQHSARVYRLAYRLTGNRHDAEDLTQEVFVRVFRSLDTYTPGTFGGWLHRITTNLFLDQARRKQRIRFDALSEERADKLSSPGPTPDAAYADRTFDDDIEQALADLPPDFRAAVVLCDIEGLSYDEIADVLGLKLGTVRSRIHRGRGPAPQVPPGPPGARHRAHAVRRPAGASRPGRPRARTELMAPITHLGTRVSALLDGQLPAAEAERAWAHVHACHVCRDLVEREGSIKTRLAGLPAARPEASTRPRT